jgi:hypothetical protein
MFERGITVISGPVGDHHRQDSSSDNDRKFRAAPIQTDVARGRLIAWSCPPECISLSWAAMLCLGTKVIVHRVMGLDLSSLNDRTIPASGNPFNITVAFCLGIGRSGSGESL